jgi:hypothetical protein
VCLYSTCVSYQGCANQSYVCPGSNESCTFTHCDEDHKKNQSPCQTDKLHCAAILDTAIIATTAAVSAALIAGIIVAVVLLCGVASGATIAIYRKMDEAGMSKVHNNPLFVDSACSGSNPLNRV